MRRKTPLIVSAGAVVAGMSVLLPSAMAQVGSAPVPADVIVASPGPALLPAAIRPVPTQGPALLPEAIRPTATSRPEPVTVSRLGVSLVDATGSGQRSGPVVIRAVCADGTTASFTIPAGASLPVTSSFIRFDHETSCTVGQVATGGATLVRWSVGTPEGERAGTGTSTEVGIWHGNYAGHTYVVRFVNSFPPVQPSASPVATPEATSTPSPGASPTATPTPSATPSTSQRPVIDPVGGKRPQVPIDPPVVPDALDPTGPTVVLPGGVDTNAGNRVRATLFCTAYKGLLDRARPMGDVPATCAVRTRRGGEVTLEMNATAPTRVWAVFYAPGTDKFRAYLRVKSWVVRP